jgi:SAM-dependent methyltransferase
VAERVTTAVYDVREPLPLPDGSVDAVFAHMLLCMALSTKEIHTVVDEVCRVLRPGGIFVYTVRHTGDAHYGAGTPHGDDIFEHGGFAVHFFDRALVDALAEDWSLEEVHGFGGRVAPAAVAHHPKPAPVAAGTGCSQRASCRCSVIQRAASRPEAAVRTAAATTVALRPSQSARMPATRAPAAYPMSRQNR